MKNMGILERLKNGMKKKAACFLIPALLSGCTYAPSETILETAKEKNYSVVITIAPVYDWARNILGNDDENIALTFLLDSGADLHNYQPTAEDMVKAYAADLFVYVGGESDDWVGDVTFSDTTKKINLMEALGGQVKEEVLIDGMEETEDEMDEMGETEYDEHIWLSLKNAHTLVETLADEFGKLDPENASKFNGNANQYIERIDALDNKYEEELGKRTKEALVFGDRFPFRYMTDDYDIPYFAAFKGCSAEAEASFETVTFLAGKVDEYDLDSIITIETSSGEIAETIKENTATKDQKILLAKSMQGVTRNDVENGFEYLDTMEWNLGTFKDALGCEAEVDIYAQ